MYDTQNLPFGKIIKVQNTIVQLNQNLIKPGKRQENQKEHSYFCNLVSLLGEYENNE